MRAGGGLGDVIEPPDGDDSEAYRILFDISFFFFIIVILLAIIQGIKYFFKLCKTNSQLHTLFEIFIFCSKIQLWFPEKIVDFFYVWKTRENVVVLNFLAVDNFDFTRKIVKKNFGWKTRENV